MAAELLACDHLADDDYIDMEITSYSNFLFCHSVISPPQPREFEFQMSSSILQEREATTSPADELFYKGKLLPLRLPPRLQMAEKLLQNSNSLYDNEKDMFEEFYSTPLATTNPTPTTMTPFESCNMSPSESCQVSRELNPDEYNFDYSTDISEFIVVENQKKPRTQTLNQSSLGSKLRASRAFLKSWFGKASCTYEAYAASTKVADEGSVSKARESLNKHVKVEKKNPFGQIQRHRYESSNSIMRTDKEKASGNGSNRHRRSFTVGIKRLSGNKSSSPSSLSCSSSFSHPNKSYGCQDLQILKKCSSANSDTGNSIQGAIAYCKQSQQLFPSRKTAGEEGLYSLSPSRISFSKDLSSTDTTKVDCR